MNPVVWSAMQDLDVLVQIDYMIPDFVDEEDLEILDIIQPIKQDVLESSWIQDAINNGGVLTAIGLVLLSVPDPIVFAIGSYFGGPVGGYIAIVVVNVVGIGLILLDQII